MAEKQKNSFKNFLLLICLFFLFPVFSFSQAHNIVRGERAAAQLYVQYAENAIERGQWSEALIVLERGSDYADVSSDISFLLAVVRSRLQKPRGSVLIALRRALEADSWDKYLPDDARMLEAENLIAMKYYEEALNVLEFVRSESPRLARLRLLALRFSSRNAEYLRFTLFVLGLYPRESEPARIFLDYLNTTNPGGQLSENESQILGLILRRLPVLLDADPELAWMAAPFIRDIGEAGRLVSAYRAVNVPVPASLLPALSLGVVDETTAMTELFNEKNNVTGHDIVLLESFYDLLRSEKNRELFMNYLNGFTGIIVRDTNRDGIPESSAVYLNGMLSSFNYDGDQDNLNELTVNFWANDPRSAVVVMPAEEGTGTFLFFREDQKRINVQWERYPAVLDAELDGERFIPRPFEFFYAPIRFGEFRDHAVSGSGITMGTAGIGILIPEKVQTAALTRRVLIANSLKVERPSLEFAGAVEVVELSQSIPVIAREYLDGRLISETDFLRGRPIAQRVDLDLDGRMETFRHFRRFSIIQDGVIPPAETLLDYRRDFDYAESDWAGDGKF